MRSELLEHLTMQSCRIRAGDHWRHCLNMQPSSSSVAASAATAAAASGRTPLEQRTCAEMPAGNSCTQGTGKRCTWFIPSRFLFPFFWSFVLMLRPCAPGLVCMSYLQSAKSEESTAHGDLKIIMGMPHLGAGQDGVAGLLFCVQPAVRGCRI